MVSWSQNLKTVCLYVRVLMPTFFLSFRRNYKSFYIFTPLRVLHCKMVFTYKSDKNWRMSIYVNVWVFNVNWGSVKEKPGVDISLLFQKAPKFHIPNRQTNRYHSTYAYTTYHCGWIWDLTQIFLEQNLAIEVLLNSNPSERFRIPILWRPLNVRHWLCL